LAAKRNNKNRTMNKIKITIAVCSLGLLAFAGDTNFVAQFKDVWQTHNASNILVFVEQNVATNKSPETLWARGSVAGSLQGWLIGTTNYWEEAIQMISTNNTYSVTGRTNTIKSLRWNQDVTAEISNMEFRPLPLWNTNAHAFIFMYSDEPLDFDDLKAISTIPSAEE
jgi:hypothetical protein